MDIGDESRRLRDEYSRMNEGELEKVAAEAYDLTEIARPLLGEEIARRGLAITLQSAPGGAKKPVPKVDDAAGLIEAGIYFDADDARTVAEYLRELGIACCWGPEHEESPDLMDFSAGVELLVSAREFESASEALRQLFTRFKPKVPAEFSEERPYACPECRSEQIVLQEVDEANKFHWSCDACGHVWEDDGVEA
jgi:hypothetical protein